MIWVIVVVVLLVLLGLFLVLTYNRLVRFRNRSENAWAQVDVQLKRRYDPQNVFHLNQNIDPSPHSSA